MQSLFSQELSLKEFDSIIVNVNEECIPDQQVKVDHIEESKYIHFKGSSEEEKDESILGSQIYSIKDATRNKTDSQIIDIIMKELGVCNNDAYVWDRMMQSISRIALDENKKSNGKE